jgi:hypothetical protein
MASVAVELGHFANPASVSKRLSISGRVRGSVTPGRGSQSKKKAQNAGKHLMAPNNGDDLSKTEVLTVSVA